MLQDGMVLLLQQNTPYNALIGSQSTVPVGAVKVSVGGSAGTPYPLVVYHQGTILDLLDVNGSTGNRTARVQFDAYSAKSYTEAKAVAKAIRDVFQNLNNTTLPDADETFVQAFYITMESDLTDIPQGVQSIIYRIMVQVEVLYIES